MLLILDVSASLSNRFLFYTLSKVFKFHPFFLYWHPYKVLFRCCRVLSLLKGDPQACRPCWFLELSHSLSNMCMCTCVRARACLLFVIVRFHNVLNIFNHCSLSNKHLFSTNLSFDKHCLLESVFSLLNFETDSNVILIAKQ